MSRRRTAVVGVLAGLSLLGPSAWAAPVEDQRCVPPKARTGYTRGDLSQSFLPAAAQTSGVDVLLVSFQDKPLERLLRVRLVGRRALSSEEDGQVTAQVVVLAEQTMRVKLAPYRPTWGKVRLAQPLVWADAGPLVDEFAVEVSLPRDDASVAWLTCSAYSHGYAAVGEDPGGAAAADTETSVAVTLGADLSFILYSRHR